MNARTKIERGAGEDGKGAAERGERVEQRDRSRGTFVVAIGVSVVKATARGEAAGCQSNSCSFAVTSGDKSVQSLCQPNRRMEKETRGDRKRKKAGEKRGSDGLTDGRSLQRVLLRPAFLAQTGIVHKKRLGGKGYFHTLKSLGELAISEQGSAASPNGSLLTATSAVLISHLSEETRAIVAGRPSVSGYRRTRLETALGGRANLLGANQETNGLELLVNRQALGPKADKAKVRKRSDFIKRFFAGASSFLFTKPD
ncbi:hypothetical protein E1301_Tti018852 [Triplophysa tibetana]|uniref:Uncharacterized protein n=1 Tax=Triplophysa tibetana TaxID=1572043 RepID=A0A5A9NKV4_9TELE|nr:hypothetical protein E1301_Tti018852 [Triplophysa tibetana]